MAVVATTAVLLAAVPLAAQDGPETRWRIRAEPMYMIAAGGDEAGLVTLEPAIPEGEMGMETNTQSIDHGPGFAFAVEYLASQHLGIEASGMLGSYDAEYELIVDGVREVWSGDIDFTAFTLGLNYHITPAKRSDWFVGLFYTSYEYDSPLLVTLRAEAGSPYPDSTGAVGDPVSPGSQDRQE